MSERKANLIKKPRQHHVWQQYLRSWTTGGKVHCLQNGRVFATGTAVLGMETDFYKVRSITDQDLALLKLVTALETLHPLQRQYGQEVIARVLSPTLFVNRYRDQLKGAPNLDEILDTYNTNVVDDHYTAIESAFAPLLTRSLRNDVGWYGSDEHCITFCQYIAMQHLRTRRTKERVTTRLKKHMNLDVSRIWHILALIFGFNAGCSVFIERKQRTLALIKNESAVPFITGDQPVVNIHADGEEAPERMTFYYPLSPRLAIFFCEPGEPAPAVAPGEMERFVADLNFRIARTSHSQIYSATPEPLEDARALLERVA
jgi:hypothetical protein